MEQKKRYRGWKLGAKMNARQVAVAKYCDGTRKSSEIAELVGDNPKYVQRTMFDFDLPSLPQGAQQGDKNPAYTGGRQIDRDGYALVQCPFDHPLRSKRRKYIREHRLVMEQKIGRYLEASEVVDHIDGLRLHNSAENLRLFENNSEHLKETLTGKNPTWSGCGESKVAESQACGGLRVKANLFHPIVDRYDRMKKSGDARLLEICRSVLKLGASSQYLLGTHRYLVEVQVDPFDDLAIELLLLEICSRWELDHTQYI